MLQFVHAQVGRVELQSRLPRQIRLEFLQTVGTWNTREESRTTRVEREEQGRNRETRLAARRCARWTSEDQLALGLYGGAGVGGNSKTLAGLLVPVAGESPLPADDYAVVAGCGMRAGARNRVRGLARGCGM